MYHIEKSIDFDVHFGIVASVLGDSKFARLIKGIQDELLL